NSSGVISISYIGGSTPPSFESTSSAGSSAIFSGTGGGTNATYYVIGSTNLSKPLTNWTRLLTNQFDAGGNFNFTNPVDPGASQWFYRLQEP
ncbi:MAG TPA: hypothetical protein VFV81_04130, partial [Verrucomicrobiae bacterium]|nr:hypothetical protein [Verrucomicrobiae bacterium]